MYLCLEGAFAEALVGVLTRCLNPFGSTLMGDMRVYIGVVSAIWGSTLGSVNLRLRARALRVWF